MIDTRHRTTDSEGRSARAGAAPADQTHSAHEMGSLQSNRDLYEQAVEVYTAATRRNPDDALAFLGKGNMLLFLHRPVEALDAYSEAVRLAPTFALAYAGLGMALRELRRYREALDAYDQAIGWDPSFAPAYFGKGLVLLCLKRYWQVLKVYQHALRLEQRAS